MPGAGDPGMTRQTGTLTSGRLQSRGGTDSTQAHGGPSGSPLGSKESPWMHPTISSSVILFSCRLSFPASGSFPMSQFFTSGGRSIEASASASNEYSGPISFRTDWFDLLEVQGALKSLLQHTVQKHQFFSTQRSLRSKSHIHT